MSIQASYFPAYPTIYTETPELDSSCQWDTSSSYGLLSPPFDTSPWSSTSLDYSTIDYSMSSYKDLDLVQESYLPQNDECYIPRFIQDDNLTNVSALLAPIALDQSTPSDLYIDTESLYCKEAPSSAYLQTPLSTPTRESATLSHSSPDFSLDAATFQLQFPHTYEAPSTPTQATGYSTPASSPKVRYSSSPSSVDASYFDQDSYVNERLDAPCKPFVMKLAHLLRNPDLYADTIAWDASGTTFIVAPSDKLLNTVLPEVFSHGSVAAFSRQLNTYGFIHLNRQQLSEKFQYSPDTTTPVRELSAWMHPYFTRDLSFLHRLLPKPSRARAAHQKAKNTMLMVEGKTLKPIKAKASPKSSPKSSPKAPKKLKLSWK